VRLDRCEEVRYDREQTSTISKRNTDITSLVERLSVHKSGLRKRSRCSTFSNLQGCQEVVSTTTAAFQVHYSTDSTGGMQRRMQATELPSNPCEVDSPPRFTIRIFQYQTVRTSQKMSSHITPPTEARYLPLRCAPAPAACRPAACRKQNLSSFAFWYTKYSQCLNVFFRSLSQTIIIIIINIFIYSLI
jgi:hypothetical protein